MNNNELKEKKVGALLIKYSIPSIITMMVTSLYNTVDRAFIGWIPKIGAFAISGIGVTMPIFTIMGAFCVGIAIGGSTNISIKLGEENKEEAERILGNAVAFELIIGILISVLGFIFMNNILYFFGASENTISYAKEYLSIILIGAWLSLPGFALNSAIRAEGNPKLAAKMMTLSCILNIILDPIFIFKFNMGIKGAAIATVISQLVVFVWSLKYFLSGKSRLKLKLQNLKINHKILKLIILIALTPFFMEVASGSIHLITNRILKIYGGDLAIGAMTSITSIILIFLMPVYGISQGMQTIIAYNHGANREERSRKALVLAIIASTIFLVIGEILILSFPEFFVRIFTKDNELINLAVNGIKINILSLWAIGGSILGTVYFQTVGHSIMSTILSLLRGVIILVPILLFLPKIYGLNGLWMAAPISDIISMVVIGILIYNKFKLKD